MPNWGGSGALYQALVQQPLPSCMKRQVPRDSMGAEGPCGQLAMFSYSCVCIVLDKGATCLEEWLLAVENASR